MAKGQRLVNSFWYKRVFYSPETPWAKVPKELKERDAEIKANKEKEVGPKVTIPDHSKTEADLKAEAEVDEDGDNRD